MAIELDKPRTARATVRKNKGDYLVAAVIDKKQVGRTEYGTGRPKLNSTGKQSQQLVITCLVIDGSKATVGGKDEARAGKAGEVVNAYFASWDFGAWIDGTKNHQLKVGDVFKWTYESDEKSTGGSDNDRKVTTVVIRHPKPGEEAQTEQCERLYREMHSQAIDLSDDRVDDEDEAPF